MRIGIYRGDLLFGPVDPLVEAAQQAADAGFPTMWLAQGPGFDAMTAAAAIGREVPGIELATAVVPTYPRHPIAMAQQALTAQAITGGRFVLGIGLSHAPLIESSYGYSFERPARHMREYLEALLPLVHDGSVDYEGETLTARGALEIRGASPVRVVLAAMGPKMLELAGGMADGTVTFMTGPKVLATHVVPSIRAAAERAGRPAPMIAAAMSVTVTDDVADARAGVERRYNTIAALPSYRAMLEREGAGSPADIAIIGNEAEVRSQIRDLEEIGITDLVVAANGTEDEVRRTVDLTSMLAREES
jgi:5,10-methylenetetrahydromethanopterin reductase